ncbi:CLUMA_CG011443, isoform A [Clunio marinus]|uniref:CLUMA_CG011443, isoform A n=1 Tax=Clunio marinus TaxID=568069 RepID=A0A1J1IE78_9DIPT|nr:CLUMA_CG011443, isoform A [Clunio marinus]
MESCEELNVESLSDCDYVKQGFCMWINNEPVNAIDFLEKRKEVLCVEYGAVLLHFFNALISFDRNKISEVTLLLRNIEKKCSQEQGWLQSIRTKLFGEQRDYSSRKSILDDLEKEIILADTLLCSSILIGISCDMPSYIKAAFILRRAWKIYNQIFKEIHELCSELCNDESPMEMGSIDFSIFHNNNAQELSSPTTSECSNWTVPSLINHNVPQSSSNISKSHSTFFSSDKKTRIKKHLTTNKMTSFKLTSECSDCDNIGLVEFKNELLRLRGAIYFGYGLLQIAFSFVPPQLKVINFFGYQGDREMGLNCLKEAKNSRDTRSLMAIIGLLYYYLIVVPFFSLENSDLSEEIHEATQILNENERFDQSALFLFFSGRRQRLKKKMKFAIMHYDASLRVPNLPRELKMLVMHELGFCLLIELKFHDAMHYFNELRVSKFSKSYYMYLTSICRGAIKDHDEELKICKDILLKVINSSSQKEGIIEKFLLNRCNFAFPDDERDEVYWKLLCYEIMYLWNLLGSCSSSTIETIIKDCQQSIEENSEPFIGLPHFLIGACLAATGDYENSINSYKKCIEICNDNPSNVHLNYIPAYASYELAVVLMKFSGKNSTFSCQLKVSENMFKSLAIFITFVALCYGATIREQNTRQGRIVGGSTAFPGQFRHQVSIRDVPTRNHLCGGFIINSRWIGSSADCTIDREIQTTRVVVGSTSLSSGGTDYGISQIINHEAYIPSLLLNDVSVIQTSVPIIFTDQVAAIALAAQVIGGGVLSQTSGWGAVGSVGDDFEFTDDLKYVTLQTITNADCRARLIASDRPGDLIFDSTLCTFTQFGQGTCAGDNGGALVWNNLVIGVTTWNVECGRGYPDMYARMASFRNWFLQNTQ